MLIQAKAPTISEYKYKTTHTYKSKVTERLIAERERERYMEQEGDGRGVGGRGEGGDMNNQPAQDQRLKEMQGDHGQVQPQPVPQPPPQQQQKCPRCDSLNTKFCYYNNYSLSQPRYFCKTCRRYWTHGGTLRNVPVGGGCRKGKRAKSSSSSTENSSRSHPQPPPPPQEVVRTQPNLTTVMRAKDPSSAVASSSAAIPSVSPYYQGDGGYLSSLAAIHSMNPSHPFNQSLNVRGDIGGSSNLGLLSGSSVASLGSHQHQVRPSQFYQMGTRGREAEYLYTAEQGLIPSSMANSSAASHRDWPQTQSFISSANYRASDASLWSTISTSSISGNSESNASAGSSSLIPNQWPDLPGFGPPP